MSGTFDLNLLPLYRLAGQDQAELPGLYAVTPPRRPARGRDADRLILYLTVVGDLSLASEQRLKLLERLAQTFYKSAGTVTAAMKLVAETLNAAMLERNLQSSNSGRQGVGLLTQIVLRGDTVYLAHSGPVHTFLARPQDSQHWYDPQGAGRGLGLTRIATVRFYQTNLQSNDFLLASHQPAEAWASEGVTVSPNQGLESLRRRLLSQAGPNVNAVLIQSQPGTGKLRFLRLKPAFQDMAHPQDTPHPQDAPHPQEVEHPQKEVLPQEAGYTQAEVRPVQQSHERVSEGDGKQVTTPLPPAGESAPLEKGIQDQESISPAISGEIAMSVPGLESETRKEQASPAAPAMNSDSPQQSTAVSNPILPGAQVYHRPEPASPKTSAVPMEASETRTKKKKIPSSTPSIFRKVAIFLRKALGELGDVFKHTFMWLFGGLGTFIKRILPDESLLNVSPATMIFFALAVPILISVVGGAVYIRRGQQRQYEAYFQQAQEAARQASTMTDPAEQRAAWKVTMEYLDKAEFYQETELSQSLRSQTQDSLDQLDATERLDFQNALIDPLDNTVQITRIVAASGDIYLLNSTQGNVYRALLTGTGYDLDLSFRCGPQAAAGNVGPLVDIVPLPRGYKNGATILGMDLNGGLIYCTPGGDLITDALTPPPMNFSNPKAFAFDSGDLFIIDPPNKAVWVYRNMEIGQPPHQFLGDITSFMVDVIDMAVNADDIYLLHSNGGMTKCTFSWTEGVPTRCEDPFMYTDNRPGRQGGEMIPDALFGQIAFAPPPDPSLYLLDPHNRAIYHFSLRLNLDRQYQAIHQLPDGAATAFAISTTRLAFLAIGNQVFYAALP